jgi:hypothetical protein
MTSSQTEWRVHKSIWVWSNDDESLGKYLSQHSLVSAGCEQIPNLPMLSDCEGAIMSRTAVLFGDPVTAKASKVRANLPGGPTKHRFERP